MNTQLKEERGTNLSVDQVQANVYTRTHTHTHTHTHTTAAMITQLKEERGTNMQVHTHTLMCMHTTLLQ
jgi:hypothetical protein